MSAQEKSPPAEADGPRSAAEPSGRADESSVKHVRPGVQITGADDVPITLSVWARLDAKVPQPPDTYAITWGDFLRQVLYGEFRHVEAESKTDVEGINFARFAPGTTRANENVIDISCWTLDLDKLDHLQVQETLKRLRADGLTFVRLSTYQHTLQAPRYRLIGPFSSAVPRAKWKATWAAIKDKYCPLADDSCKDPSRAYYAPSHPVGGVKPVAEVIEGVPLDVSSWDVSVEPPKPAKPATLQGELKPASSERYDEQIADLAEALLPVWTDGRRHALRLKVAGVLRHAAWPFEAAERLLIDVLTPASGTEKERKTITDTYAAAIHSGTPALKEYLQNDELADRIHEIANRQVMARNRDEFAAMVARHEGDVAPAVHESSPLNVASAAASADKVVNTLGNLSEILSRHPDWVGVLQFDEFANRTTAEKTPPMRAVDVPSSDCRGEWTDSHSARVRTWVEEHFKFSPGKDNTELAVDMAARTNTVHPVRDYLKSLTWDGKPRIDTMLTDFFGVVRSPYTSAISGKFLISCVARAMKPGCKVDTVLILEGEQGTQKSSAITVLASEAWFSDSKLDLESKDGIQTIQGKWIYEIAEMHAFTRASVERIKAFITSARDNLRPSYGRRNVDMPRGCVFVCTTNSSEYLADTTGNRRFWPVVCHHIDLPGLRAARDQLWAEALARYMAGEQWWLTGEQEALAREEQAAREATDTWEDVLRSWFAAQPIKPDGWTAGEVLTSALHVSTEHQTHAQSIRIGRLLQKIGCTVSRVRDGGGRGRRRYGKPT